MREMRRSKQSLSYEECIELLEKSTYGTLALGTIEDYPYAIPISYVYHDGKLIFHSATEGKKLDAIKLGCKASFCVAYDEVVPLEYTTRYKSVICFGSLSLITEGEKLREYACLLGKRYNPEDTAEGLNNYIEKYKNRFLVIAMDIEHMTGKQGSAYLKSKE